MMNLSQQIEVKNKDAWRFKGNRGGTDKSREWFREQNQKRHKEVRIALVTNLESLKRELQRVNLKADTE